MKYIVTIILLLGFMSVMAQKQGKVDKKQKRSLKKSENSGVVITADPEPLEKDGKGVDREECFWPPRTYKEIEFRSVLVSKVRIGNDNEYIPQLDKVYPRGEEPETQPEDAPIDLSGLKNNMISSKKEFAPFKDRIILDVDWKKEKLVFYTNSTTYKFGHLDSDYNLMGAALSEDGKTLMLGYRSTFYGVCQGIAQLQEWYSNETDTFCMVIPKSVETITSTSCYFGPDCSDIP